jgi:hypothetical protein
VKIDDWNPYPTFRPGQREQIEAVLNSYDANVSDVVTLDVPTAGGKSLTIYILGKIIEEELREEYNSRKPGMDGERGDPFKAIYSNPLVSLTNQLRDNKLFDLPTLVGKSNYKCLAFEGETAEDCPFEGIKPTHAICKKCPYKIAKGIFNSTIFCAETFDRFYLDVKTRYNTKFLFVDESATLFDNLVSKSEVIIPDRITKKNVAIELEKHYNELIVNKRNLDLIYTMALMKFENNPNSELLKKGVQKAKKDLRFVEREAERIEKALLYIEKNIPFIVYKRTDPVYDKKEKKKVPKERNYFKLLDVKYVFKQMVKNMDLVVLASGTPSSELYVDGSMRHKVISMPHPIDVNRRLVYFHEGLGSGSKSARKASAPNAADMIVRLHNKFNKHTIVHTGTYEYARMIQNELIELHPSDQIICQREDFREECLELWQSTPESIFLCVKFTDGLDLKGTEYPLGVIAGLNFPNRGDPWIAERCKLDGDRWYNIQVANSVMQACGRNTRDENDFGEVHIIDHNFGWHYAKFKNTFYNKKWFQEAIRYV